MTHSPIHKDKARQRDIKGSHMTAIQPTVGPLAGHPTLLMLDVVMSSIVSDYDDADLVSEWQWVKRMASHEHVGVQENSTYEYTLNLAMEFDTIPPSLQPLLAAAKQAGVSYILFYND